MSKLQYSVCLEIDHIKSKEEAEELAVMIRNKFKGIQGDTYLCIMSVDEVQTTQEKESGK